MATESFRVSFNTNNEQHLREFLLLNSMDTRTRNQFIHLAIGLLGRKIGYIMPKDGMMGVFASLSGNASINTVEIPDLDMSNLPIKKKSVKSSVKTEKKQINEFPKEDDMNESDEASAFILGTLKGFDEQL